jgi:adenine-specific DNA methylase
LKKPGPATDATYGKVYYTAPTIDDIRRENKVVNLLKERFLDWQSQGFIPNNKIEAGYNTTQPIRERGWQYWHHLFNPRQLLIIGYFLIAAEKIAKNKNEKTIAILGVNRLTDNFSKLCGWNFGYDKGNPTFVNQSLNTMSTYSCRGLAALFTSWLFELTGSSFDSNSSISINDAR